MNRIVVAIAMCVLLCGSSSAADPNLFVKATINKDSINVTFPDTGTRYLIELNGKSLGINEYGQNLLFNKTDKLRLSEKHFSYLITFLQINGKCYLQIKETGIDQKSGEEVKKAYYKALEIE
jgi:hypothetical protein